MNKRYLSIGLMQYKVDYDVNKNIEKIERNVYELMKGLNRPEIIVGPELGLGLFPMDTVPGNITERLSRIAEEYGVYFLPGSMRETENLDNGKSAQYNTLPIFGPSGELIDKYRKVCPYYPVESSVTPGNRYVVFDIKEKDIKIGVMICHDWCFPEVSRNLTLLGAEVLLRPAIDPEGLYESFRHVPSVRSLENQAYFVSVNAVGYNAGSYAYGHTMVTDPEGKILYEAGSTPLNHCITLDIDVVTRNRTFGTFFSEQLLRQFGYLNIPMPFAGKSNEAPVFKHLPEADISMKERYKKIRKVGINKDLGKP